MRGRAVGLAGSTALALVLLAATPAGAHPNPVSQDLESGRPTTITVFLYPDEGPVSGFDVTLPSSFHLTTATGDAKLPVVTTSGSLVTFRLAAGEAPMMTPAFSTVTLVGTPTQTPVYLHFVAQRSGQAPFDYGQTLVGAPVNVGNPSSIGTRVAVTAGLLVVGGIAAFLVERTRRRRRRRGTLTP